MSMLDLYKPMIGVNDTVDTISFVEFPAIEQNFIAFSSPKEEVKFAVADSAERCIISPVLIPDKLIYRREDNYEYNIVFSADDIKKLQLHFYKRGYQRYANLEHETFVEGITYFSSFISDEKLGIVNPIGFEDLPIGTWFTIAKVDNDEVWNSILEGKYNGLSIEGWFNFEKVSMSKEKSDKDIISEMENMYKNLSKL